MGWVANASEAVDAESEWRTIISICVALSVCSIAVVSCRLYIRAKARGLAADDYLAALSMTFAFAYSILCIVQTRFGLGLPIKDRPKANIIPYTRVNFAGRPIYQMGISFFKIALCISYLRLLKRTDQRIYRMIVWTVITFIFLAHLGCTFSLMFACHPIRKSWDPLTKGTCLAPGPSFTGYAAVTIASDIIVAVLPIPVLLRLNVPQSKKLGLIGIFLLGLFTTVCSILRYSQIGRIQYGDGNSTMLVLWGTIEFNVGNMVSSLPFLAPVFVRKAKEYRSKNSYNATASPDHSRASNGRNEDDVVRLCTRGSEGVDPEKGDSINSGRSNSNSSGHGIPNSHGNSHIDGIDKTNGQKQKQKQKQKQRQRAISADRWNAAFGNQRAERPPEMRRPAFAIFKSVTYSVRVDEGVTDQGHGRRAVKLESDS